MFLMQIWWLGHKNIYDYDPVHPIWSQDPILKILEWTLNVPYVDKILLYWSLNNMVDWHFADNISKCILLELK